MDGLKDQYEMQINSDDSIDPTYNTDPDHPDRPIAGKKFTEHLL